MQVPLPLGTIKYDAWDLKADIWSVMKDYVYDSVVTFAVKMRYRKSN